jgi:hypothetical protein
MRLIGGIYCIVLILYRINTQAYEECYYLGGSYSMVYASVSTTSTLVRSKHTAIVRKRHN